MSNINRGWYKELCGSTQDDITKEDIAVIMILVVILLSMIYIIY